MHPIHDDVAESTPLQSPRSSESNFHSFTSQNDISFPNFIPLPDPITLSSSNSSWSIPITPISKHVELCIPLLPEYGSNSNPLHKSIGRRRFITSTNDSPLRIEPVDVELDSFSNIHITPIKQPSSYKHSPSPSPSYFPPALTRKKDHANGRWKRWIISWSWIFFLFWGFFFSIFFLIDLIYVSKLQKEAMAAEKQEALLQRDWNEFDFEKHRNFQETSPEFMISATYEKERSSSSLLYSKLLSMAAFALTEGDGFSEYEYVWKGIEKLNERGGGEGEGEGEGVGEGEGERESWSPCSNHSSFHPQTLDSKKERFILLSVYGNLNQQRISICNMVAIAHFLNSTLVLPTLISDSDQSTFGDIFDMHHFVNEMKEEGVRIVKTLPTWLNSIDLQIMGSQVNDVDHPKEMRMGYFFRFMPILSKNSVLFFDGFSKKLAFDPIPLYSQKIRCRCHFHALRFHSLIQTTSDLMISRIRQKGHFRPHSPFEQEGKVQVKKDVRNGKEALKLHAKKKGEEGGEVEFVHGENHRLSFVEEVKTKERGETEVEGDGRKDDNMIMKNESILSEGEEGRVRTGKGVGEDEEEEERSQKEGRERQKLDDMNGGEEKKVKEEEEDEEENRFLAFHMRFEIDILSFSMCEFGGGEKEKEELRTYRRAHFPSLTKFENKSKTNSSQQRREEGLCPLTPEEMLILFAALGIHRHTKMYMAFKSNQMDMTSSRLAAFSAMPESRLAAFSAMYPNMYTKHSLLSQKEIAPFLHSPSMLQALDFLVCSKSNAFATSDMSSHFSAMVTGHRIYFKSNPSPTLQLPPLHWSNILTKSQTPEIEWNAFVKEVRELVYVQTLSSFSSTLNASSFSSSSSSSSSSSLARPRFKSVYRNPRSEGCMCLDRHG